MKIKEVKDLYPSCSVSLPLQATELCLFEGENQWDLHRWPKGTGTLHWSQPLAPTSVLAPRCYPAASHRLSEGSHGQVSRAGFFLLLYVLVFWSRSMWDHSSPTRD